MPKLTKTQGKKRLQECLKKLNAVHYGSIEWDFDPIPMADYIALDKILRKCLKRFK